MCIVAIWPAGVAGGRAVLLEVREKPPKRCFRPFSLGSSIVLPSTGVKADMFLQCLTTLVRGRNGLSMPGANSRSKLFE